MNCNQYHIIKHFLVAGLLFLMTNLFAAKTIELTISQSSVGAPITLGIPFAQGSLQSPDHVRVLDKNGQEIPSQVTMVTNWEPADFSVKWVWVFFFSTGDTVYDLEYGEDIRKAAITGDKIKIKNAQRTGQSSMVETGPLRFTISKKGGGFIDDVLFDVDGDGFDGRDTIATTKGLRGSFLDLLDDMGIDSSKAIINRTFREKGSGPLHAIIRLEGVYSYDREDNRDSPFTIRIHVYAGKSYVKVYHTLTYTGIPDKHKPREGQHANIALSADTKIKNDAESEDEGWMIPNDQIAATGLSLDYNIRGNLKYACGYKEGSWSDPQNSKYYTTSISESSHASVFQSGPKPDRIPPVPNSDMEERIGGFHASIKVDGAPRQEMDRAEGWADLSDERWGICVGIKNFLEEYPKEISFNGESPEAIAYFWSPNAGPMSFARSNNKRDQGMIANFAEGVTKTSEAILYFHDAENNSVDLPRTMNYVLDPPIPHAEAEAYSRSLVYGHFSPRQNDNLELERSLDYKFDWQLFNQHWEPWYGMFDYGDQKNLFFREDWYRWQNNEPAIDFMYWLQFMRTGDPKYYQAAESMSRHTMDVDNVHWPTDPIYYGTTNDAVDYFNMEAAPSIATPYLGIGRRHANQHWTALLSAHVWLKGWVASYYISGYHRGLDIAKLTSDSYLRRIWGEHDLRGRRLYLSVWNLIETWDATKDPKYLEEINDRIDIMLQLQNGSDQYGSLVIDRYGYSQIYASHSLSKYYQLTGEERVKNALVTHARAVRDNPPYNHEYESYLATIHPLLIGYEYTGDQSFLDEALLRSEVMKTDKLNQSFKELGTQKNIAEALEEVSHLPLKGDFQASVRWTTNWSPVHGLRVFGWTHIFNVPWLLDCIRRADDEDVREAEKK